MLELCTLASGSSGNSLLVTDGRTHVLVDAGISCRRICTGLKSWAWSQRSSPAC